MKKLLCSVLLAALLLAIAAPAFALTVPQSATVYMLSTDGSFNWWNYGIGISDVAKTATIGKPTSSKPGILSVVGLSRYSSEETYYDEEYSSGWNDATIYVRPQKVGTAVISVKIAKKIYKISAAVKKYYNPVKNFVLTGISTENLSTKFAKKSYINGQLEKASKKGYLKVAAKSGWKIQSVRWENEKTGLTHSRWLGNPVSSLTLGIPSMKTTMNYYISVEFVNTATGASIPISYEIGDFGGE